MLELKIKLMSDERIKELEEKLRAIKRMDEESKLLNLIMEELEGLESGG